MEHEDDEDNECPKCEENCFYEHIFVDSEDLEGKEEDKPTYEFSCSSCGYSGEYTMKFEEVIR